MFFLTEVERCENIMLTLVKRSRNDSIHRLHHVLGTFLIHDYKSGEHSNPKINKNMAFNFNQISNYI